VRRYEETHPWITFEAKEINDMDPRTWILLGEARSKCEHLAGSPLQPEVAGNLNEVTLIKGARATTAIEGNTLTEEQVGGILKGTYQAPPSRQYQEQEVRNILDALNDIEKSALRGEQIVLTKEVVCDYNRRVLRDLELPPGVVAGEVRKDYSVGVANYRGAPAEDCDYLLERLAEWLEGPTFNGSEAGAEIRFSLLLMRAVIAHLYLAWVHPFGGGNGRTARLVEFAILARSGLVPLPAVHLLSNHYNLTRDRYYKELELASAKREIRGFVSYAIEGFVDGIREAIDLVREQQLRVAWVNYVYEILGRQPNTKATDRQRRLVLALPTEQPVRRSDIAGLSSRLATLYASAGPRTIARDVNKLMQLGLVVTSGPASIRANSDKMKAFRPPTAPSL
jgi:Fic family protein